MAFYEKYVGRSALLDYVEMVCKNISQRYVEPPDWWSPPPPEQDPPQLRKPDVLCYEDRESGTSRYCVRCQQDADEETRQLEEDKKNAAKEKKTAKKTREQLRARMKAQAKKPPPAKKQRTG